MLGLRTSKWTYDTGATGGAGLGPLLVSGGTFFLKDPAGQEQQFHYAGGGFGWGRSIGLIPKKLNWSLPKFLKIAHEPAATGSTKDFFSGGLVCMTGSFRGDELKRSDLVGPTIYIDASAGIVADGFSVSVMLLGLNQTLLMMGIAMPQLPFFRIAMNEARALLVMYGANVGLQSGTLQSKALGVSAGVGAGLMFGNIH
jgi:hypothetical protein